jgi:hypothetical protein
MSGVPNRAVLKIGGRQRTTRASGELNQKHNNPAIPNNEPTLMSRMAVKRETWRLAESARISSIYRGRIE